MSKIELLTAQMLLDIDSSVGKLMQLRNEVEKIANNCAKLQDAHVNISMTDVSTSVLDNGLTPEMIAKALNKRDKTRRKQYS